MAESDTSHTGRFAPSPTGPLHQGSLVAAMASFLDARAHGGRWLVRIEDVDETRAVPGADRAILSLLGGLGMAWDGEVVWQSARKERYAAACAQLCSLVYPCACSRREIADSRLGDGPDGAPIYPGTCRHGPPSGKPGRALRLRLPAADEPAATVEFLDRWQGPCRQNLAAEVGDFVLRRADGLWAYQLAVVVDDAAQGVTHVVRGADLLGSTARQIHLQRALGLPTPHYLHVPVLADAAGEKLSKQTGAAPLGADLCLARRLACLAQAAHFLGLGLGPEAAPEHASIPRFWEQATAAWRRKQFCATKT